MFPRLINEELCDLKVVYPLVFSQKLHYYLIGKRYFIFFVHDLTQKQIHSSHISREHVQNLSVNVSLSIFTFIFLLLIDKPFNCRFVLSCVTTANIIYQNCATLDSKRTSWKIPLDTFSNNTSLTI